MLAALPDRPAELCDPILETIAVAGRAEAGADLVQASWTPRDVGSKRLFLKGFCFSLADDSERSWVHGHVAVLLRVSDHDNRRAPRSRSSRSHSLDDEAQSQPSRGRTFLIPQWLACELTRADAHSARHFRLRFRVSWRWVLADRGAQAAGASRGVVGAFDDPFLIKSQALACTPMLWPCKVSTLVASSRLQALDA